MKKCNINPCFKTELQHKLWRASVSVSHEINWIFTYARMYNAANFTLKCYNEVLCIIFLFL